MQMSQPSTIQVESNKVFAWPKELRLVASEQVTILLPGALVPPGAQIGSVIDVPDDAEIGFKESENPDEHFIHIILRLKKGQSVGVARSTQAMVLTESVKTIIFEVED
jgi:hypothetical protein